LKYDRNLPSTRAISYAVFAVNALLLSPMMIGGKYSNTAKEGEDSLE
jgi:hypothetical protein